MRTAREIALAVLCSGEKHKDKKRRYSGDIRPFERNSGDLCRYFLESPRNARVRPLHRKISTKNAAIGDGQAWLRIISTQSAAILKTDGCFVPIARFQAPDF